MLDTYRTVCYNMIKLRDKSLADATHSKKEVNYENKRNIKFRS